MYFNLVKSTPTEKRYVCIASNSLTRPFHSCATAQMNMYDGVVQDVSTKSFVIKTFLDFSAALRQ